MRYMYNPRYEDNLGLPPAQGSRSERPLAFSPELSLMLAMILKDNPEAAKVKRLLKDISPYVSKKDRMSLDRLLAYMDYEDSKPGWETPQGDKADFAHLADTLVRYSGPDASPVLESMKKMFETREKMNVFMKKIARLQNSDGMAIDEMLELVSLISPGTDMSGMGNMASMINMFKSMKGLDISSMMNMMGGGK